jgi:transposase InsO family protein
MSRAPFLKCAQCELRHEGAFETKRAQKVNVVLRCVGTQTSQPVLKAGLHKKQAAVIVGYKGADQTAEVPKDESDSEAETEVGTLPSSKEGEKVGDRNSHSDRAGQTSKARALTRSRVPKGQPAQAASPSWLEGGVCLDKCVVRDEQLKDPASVDAICWLQSGHRPEKADILSSGLDLKFLWGNYDTLVLQDGLLCRKVGPLFDGSTKVTVYVPPSLRREVTRLCHDTKTAGHFYFWKTVNKIKRHFTWGGLNKDVQIYCKACHVCATRKNAGRRQKAEMRRYDVGFPMEEVAIDIMGPFPVSDDGNKYVLVVVDSFSKWMEAYPLENIEAKTVAEKLVLEFVSRFGVPYQIKSDRGKQFDCALFREMCVLLDVDHKMSTPFHPQGNSRVERMVKVVGNLIALFCQTYKTWDKNLPLLTLAYRSTVHEVTGFTPNFVMTGREISLPLDVMMGSLQPDDRTTAPEYVDRLKTRLDTCFTEVRHHLKEFGERQRRYYNLSTHGEQYKTGDLVYLREKTRKVGVSPKLMPKWKGPFVILKRFGTVYEVMMSLQASKLYHFDLLKPCHATEVSSWVKKARRRALAPGQTQ